LDALVRQAREGRRDRFLDQLELGAVGQRTRAERQTPRLGRRAGDFAEWIRTSLDMPQLADKIERIDTYMTNLERVRARVLMLVDAALEEATV